MFADTGQCLTQLFMSEVLNMNRLLREYNSIKPTMKKWRGPSQQKIFRKHMYCKQVYPLWSQARRAKRLLYFNRCILQSYKHFTPKYFSHLNTFCTICYYWYIYIISWNAFIVEFVFVSNNDSEINWSWKII